MDEVFGPSLADHLIYLREHPTLAKRTRKITKAAFKPGGGAYLPPTSNAFPQYSPIPQRPRVRKTPIPKPQRSGPIPVAEIYGPFQTPFQGESVLPKEVYSRAFDYHNPPKSGPWRPTYAPKGTGTPVHAPKSVKPNPILVRDESLAYQLDRVANIKKNNVYRRASYEAERVARMGEAPPGVNVSEWKNQVIQDPITYMERRIDDLIASVIQVDQAAELEGEWAPPTRAQAIRELRQKSAYIDESGKRRSGFGDLVKKLDTTRRQKARAVKKLELEPDDVLHIFTPEEQAATGWTREYRTGAKSSFDDKVVELARQVRARFSPTGTVSQPAEVINVDRIKLPYKQEWFRPLNRQFIRRKSYGRSRDRAKTFVHDRFVRPKSPTIRADEEVYGELADQKAFNKALEDLRKTHAAKTATTPSMTPPSVAKAEVAAKKTIDQVTDIADDLLDKTATGVAKTFDNAKTVGSSAMEEAIAAAEQFQRLDRAGRRAKLASAFKVVKESSDTLKDKGIGRVIHDVQTTFSDVNDLKGSAEADVYQHIKNIVSSVDGMPVSESDYQIASSTVGKMTDVDQLSRLAHAANTSAAKSADAITDPARRLSALRAILREKLSMTSVSSIEESMLTGKPAAVVGRLTKAQRVARGRMKTGLVSFFDRVNESQIGYIGEDAVRQRRILKLTHPNVGGITQTKYIGGGNRLVFDVANKQRVSVLRSTMQGFDESGYAKEGVMNSFGLRMHTIETLRESTEFSDDVLGINLEAGRALGIKVKRMYRSTGANGKKQFDDSIQLVAELTRKEKAKISRLSKDAYDRVLSIDIETSHGLKQKYAKLAELLRGADVEEMKQIEAPFMYIQEARGKQALEEFYKLLEGGLEGQTPESLQAAYAKLTNADSGVDWITQASFQSFVGTETARGEGIGTLQHITREKDAFGITSRSWGDKNVGRTAGTALSLDEFDEVVDALIAEERRQRKIGGAVIGLNVENFDMKFIRQQTALMGQYEMAQWEMVKGKHSIIQQAYSSTVDRTALHKIMMEQTGATNAGDASRIYNQWTRWRDSGAKKLAYSGRYNRATNTYSADASQEVRDYLLNHGFKGVNAPLADTVHTGDITSLYRTFNVSAAATTEAEWQSTIRKRAKAHIMGLNADGTTDSMDIVAGQNRKLSSMARNIFNNDADAGDLASRMLRANGQVSQDTMFGLIDDVVGTEDVAVKKVFRDVFGASRNKTYIEEALKGVDNDQVAEVMKQLQSKYGALKLEEVHQTMLGTMASSEQLLYGNREIYEAAAGGKLFVRGQNFWDMASHQATRDAFLTTYGIDLSFKRIKDLGKMVVRNAKNAGGLIQETMDEFGETAASAIRRIEGMSMTFAGHRGEESATGRGAFAILNQDNMVRASGEVIDQYDLKQAVARTMGGLYSDMRNSFGRQMTRTAEKIAKEGSEALGTAIDVGKVQKNLRGAVGIGAVAVVAAGAIAAGTMYRKRHEFDDSWKYAPVENPINQELQKRRRQDLSIGSIAIESHNRRNYSFNMRQDKHNHLFGGR